MKVGNIECRGHVTACTPFCGSNLSGIKVSNRLYIVYSYGHWPIWAKINGKWYGHPDKYSSTTSCHTSASKPEADIKMLKSIAELRAKIDKAS